MEGEKELASLQAWSGLRSQRPASQALERLVGQPDLPHGRVWACCEDLI